LDLVKGYLLDFHEANKNIVFFKQQSGHILKIILKNPFRKALPFEMGSSEVKQAV
jgi:hypothetical protein